MNFLVLFAQRSSSRFITQGTLIDTAFSFCLSLSLSLSLSPLANLLAHCLWIRIKFTQGNSISSNRRNNWQWMSIHISPCLSSLVYFTASNVRRFHLQICLLLSLIRFHLRPKARHTSWIQPINVLTCCIKLICVQQKYFITFTLTLLFTPTKKTWHHLSAGEFCFHHAARVFSFHEMRH